ncbi:hypothetical protein EI77_02223 [Prosthecobacter fusiformis]|uniref:Uncharacterized protein n=1 Tax=Prosthecobacter fusiformis TaxID=48464 RepID=A0A4R7S1M1_9BACT|nr:hypothetical protein [Prosthecobacter fusiformis]TDU71105.1 hypothetical protein EI77_02223 [Prosthecobacter fusiformis]
MKLFPFRWFFRREEPPIVPPSSMGIKSVPGTTMKYVAFPQPPMAPYAYASRCYQKNMDAALAEELKQCGPSVFMLVAADETRVLVQNHQGKQKLDRATIHEISLHPVLPAKGSGMIILFFEVHQNGQLESQDFIMCPPYDLKLQEWCHKKAEEVAALLNVPFKITEPSYDC